MLMNEGLDTGDMLLSEKLPIDENMTAGELHDKLSLSFQKQSERCLTTALNP